MQLSSQRPQGRFPMVVVVCALLALNACGGGGDEPETRPFAAASTALFVPATSTAVSNSPSAQPAQTDSTPQVVAAAPLAGSVNAPVAAVVEPLPVGAAAPASAASAAAPATSAPVAAVVTAAVSGTSTPADTSYLRMVYVDAGAASAGNGSAANPYRTIGTAMSNLRPGDDIVVAAGTYREWVVVPALPADGAATRIRAAVTRSVTIKGSQETSGWTLVSPGVYAVGWSEPEPEQVFRDGVLLKQIGGTVFSGFPLTPTADLGSDIWPARVNGSVGELVGDSFTYDAAGRRLVVKVSTPLGAAEKLEVSTRQHVLQAESANNFTVEGIDFAHSNTSRDRRWGAIKVVGKFNTLRNLAVRDMDSTCVQIVGEDNALLDSTIERCGQTGLSGHGRRLTVANNQVLSNNTRGFNKWWEAGGMKLIGYGGLHDSVIRNNVVAYNDGDGIWLDTKNTNILIEGNTAAYNAGFGIHYETSSLGIIRGNRTYGNTMRGIYLSESSSTLVERNAVFGNAMEGIGVIDAERSAVDATLKPFDNRVLNNTVAWNDFERNWIQLVLPGDGFRSVSDNNAFKAERIAPRMSMAFFSPTNWYDDRLDVWQARRRVDLASTTQTTPMPAALKAALAAKRLLTTEQLPATLATPGTY